MKMSEEKNQEKEEPIIIKDKRHFRKDGSVRPENHKKAESKEEKPHGEEKIKEAKTSEETPLPDVDFSSFVFSLSTSALIQLGIIKDPITKKVERNLSGAKQTINIINMLKEKTKGNLSSEEDTLIDTILFDLRMKYVSAVEKKDK